MEWYKLPAGELLYQDFNEQFEGYTQHGIDAVAVELNCFIRISMNNLKDIHNDRMVVEILHGIALSGFQ